MSRVWWFMGTILSGRKLTFVMTLRESVKRCGDINLRFLELRGSFRLAVSLWRSIKEIKWKCSFYPPVQFRSRRGNIEVLQMDVISKGRRNLQFGLCSRDQLGCHPPRCLFHWLGNVSFEGNEMEGRTRGSMIALETKDVVFLAFFSEICIIPNFKQRIQCK